MLVLHPAAVATMREATTAALPVEACGLLLGVGREVTRAAVVPNRAPDPRRHYRMLPADLAPVVHDAIAGSLDIVAAWHSHPSGRSWPSAGDLADAHSPLVMVLVTPDGALHGWSLGPARAARPVGVALLRGQSLDHPAPG